jgi:hypothetical protein
LNKQILLLSAALAALASSPAFAEDSPDWRDITTEVTVPVDTAHATPGDPEGTPGDIKLDTGGSITVQVEGAAVTINSNNAFEAVAGTTISNAGTSNAVGILVDLTTVDRDSTTCSSGDSCFFGITESGTMDLSGDGDSKKGVWLQGPEEDSETGPFSFIGDIDLSGSTITVTGDNSVGVQIDSLADLKGNLDLGTLNVKTTASTSTAGVTGFNLAGAVYGDITAAGIITVTGTKTAINDIIGMNIAGDVFGNVTINESQSVNAIGLGAQSVVITGNLNPCDTTVSPDCDPLTSDGALINKGSLTALGFAGSTNAAVGNPDSGSALAIGGNIAGGIFNAGPAFSDDETLAASISSVGPTSTILISPSVANVTEPTALTIGVYTADITDPGFSFYNRGAVSALSSNIGESSHAITIDGSNSQFETTLVGGLYNSGTIRASATSGTEDNTKGAVEAIAIHIDNFGVVGPNDLYVFNEDTGQFEYQNGDNKHYMGGLNDDRAALVNSATLGSGIISATIAGPYGGSAVAIDISAEGMLPSIINSGTITAIATSTDLSIDNLTASAILDRSGTLTYIQNNGTISAAASVLDDDSQIAVAIDLLGGDGAAADGVEILNQATADTTARIIGDILFGTGKNQVVDVEGASTERTASIVGDIAYGEGSDSGSDKLIIGNFATVTGRVTASELLGVSVDVKGGGTLNLLNDSRELDAYDFHLEAGSTLNLTVKESFRDGIINVISSDGVGALLDQGAKFNITYGSFVPVDSDFVLITAPNGMISVADLGIYNTQLEEERPFLFEQAVMQLDTSDANDDKLVLHVETKDADQLGLSGYAAQILPFANQALSVDDTLGAAFVAGITDQKTAQLAYNQMAPNVSGGERAIAIALTDQSSGPVAARQRILRMYGKASGGTTLWGEEFAEFVQDPGNRSTGQTGFKDHGFGFVLGIDGGDPRGGWYGGAFSFYSGDIVEPLPRDSHTNTLWYMLTGYTDWRGKGLFLDTKVDIGYMDLKGKRYIDLTIPNAAGTSATKFVDEADSKRPGLVGAIGVTTGAVLAYGSTVITPQISIDGMTMREEGYTETHASSSVTTGNGKGMLLQTQAFYASSARIFLGADFREDLNFGDFFVQPDLRLGYRYDFLNDATKLKVNFADIGTLANQATPGPVFTVVGPDPAQGNFVAGASIAATTDAWTLGANFDFIRGSNGATTEVGTIHLLGRI